MHSQALNKIRRLRRDRYGQATTGAKRQNNISRRKTLLPSSLVDHNGNQSNIPRQRPINKNMLSSTSIRSISMYSFSHMERHESLTNSLMDANYLEMKSKGFIPSVSRGLGHYNNKKECILQEADCEAEEDDDYDDEECGCIPGKDLASKERREYWRRRFRDIYIQCFIFMFISAILVSTSQEKANDKNTEELIKRILASDTIHATKDKNDGNSTESNVNSMMKLLEQLHDLTIPFNKNHGTPFFLD